MVIKEYLVKAYAFLVKAKGLDIESLPVDYQIPVAEHLVQEAEKEAGK